jgi:hypothetical protein
MGVMFILAPEKSIPGGQNPFAWVIICIKATFIDQLKIYFELSFCITLWRFEESQSFFYHTSGHNPEVETHFQWFQILFPVCQTCIEATFIDRFEPDLTQSFRMGKNF